MVFSPQSDFQEAFQRIEVDILSGRLRPRQRLVESDLMAEYAASRGTVRKILKALHFKHLVTLYTNKGAVVADPTRKEMEDIYAARVVLEGNAAEGVIRNMDASTLNRAASHAKAFERAFEHGNLPEIIASNRLFHQTLFETCGNSVIGELIDDLRKRSHIWQHYVVGYPERMRRTITQHNGIMECIRNKDQEGFRQINEQHLAEGYRSYIEDLTWSQGSAKDKKP